MFNDFAVGIRSSLWSRVRSRIAAIPSSLRASQALSAFLKSGPIRLLALCGIGLVLAICLLTSLITVKFGERVLDTSQRTMSNTALLVANHVDQLFEQIELVQDGIISLMRSKGIDTPEDFAREMSTFDAHLLLRDRAGSLSYLDETNLYKADGTLLNFSSAWPTPTFDIADRDYFRTLVADHGLTKVVSAPLTSRATGHHTIIMARKFKSQRGDLIGVIGSGIRVGYFNSYFDSILVGNCCSISLLRGDGLLLVRAPAIPYGVGKILPAGKAVSEGSATMIQLIGSQKPQNPVFRLITSLWQRDRDVARIQGDLGMPDRLVVADWSRNFPLFVIVGGDIGTTLSAWYQQARVFATSAGLFLLVVVIVFGLIIRKLFQQHVASEQALLAEKERLNTAVANMTQGLVLFDRSAKVVVSNERYASMYGLPAEKTKPGRPLYDILCEKKRVGSFQGDVDAYFYSLLQQIKEGMVAEGLRSTPDGRVIQIVHKPLGNGGWVTTHEDVTERRRAEERIAHLAHHDSLTDLPNRSTFWEELLRALTWARRRELVAVLYLDLDDFKSVNDSLGHSTGDELIKAVGRRLASTIREGDFVARIGGDEFAIIQGGIAGSSDVMASVTRIQTALREPFEIGTQQILIDSSVGIAIHPGDGNDPETLLKNADLALYSAKAAGRGTYMFFEAEMDDRFKARRALEIELRQALASGGLELHYQPVVSCRTGAIVGCEALLRWHHPERGWIAASEFIPIAEETNLINALGEWVLRRACNDAASWPEAVKVAVNVSPMQLKNRALALIVVGALAEAHLAPRRLELEITEAVRMGDDDAASILRELRSLGVRIALDDFGTGYSSLAYLLKFPFDKIKIDRSFIEGIASAGGSLPIVEAIIDIAGSQHMTTTAEGVETEEQLTALRSLGCTEIQGYLFSKPLPQTHLLELLSQNEAAALTG
jgi:diguanylate cyclase (GGDEF)-like protein